jgi:hypothetical protein
MMNIMFEAPRGKRILRSPFMGITVFRNDYQPSLWWCYATRKWVTANTATPHTVRHHTPIATHIEHFFGIFGNTQN